MSKVREAFLFRRDAQVEDGDHDDLSAVFINWVDQSIERHPENMTTEVNPQTKLWTFWANYLQNLKTSEQEERTQGSALEWN